MTNQVFKYSNLSDGKSLFFSFVEINPQKLFLFVMSKGEVISALKEFQKLVMSWTKSLSRNSSDQVLNQEVKSMAPEIDQKVIYSVKWVSSLAYCFSLKI